MTVIAQRRATSAGFILLVSTAIFFIALPIVALATRISPAEVAQGLATPAARSALLVSLIGVGCAMLAVIAFGTPVAFLLARGKPGPVVNALDVLFDLPMVLPPAVAGIALLAAFGEGGLIGDQLTEAGLAVPFTRVAVVIALAFVASPLYIRQVQAAFSACDRDVLEASYTSGVGPIRHFFLVELPLAKRGMLGGIALAGARALGEFGATMVFAGSVVGVTQTLTLAIYGSMESDSSASFALAMLLLLMTIAASVGARVIGRGREWELEQ